ncbi:hypothetical protein Taro_004635 [Colocasia esculenta]|uniref:Ubiquitin-like domain-containing protein n=1 Tax=Colocasia esculenta TaxID=4460 RepID=A0A843TKQ4_COLES|nr:hypothetical protein [Colocasia esculenta]
MMWKGKGRGEGGERSEEEGAGGAGGGRGDGIAWEMRPGGMLVQKRCPGEGDSSSAPVPPAAAAAAPMVRVRVAYGAARHEVCISSQATFGGLKKLLAGETGLQPAEQRLLYKGKERENGEYLDTCGVKNRSKIVLVEDPASVERRYLERRRMAKVEGVKRAVSDASMEIDKLADQVNAMEKSISNGTKVADVQISTLVELLMRQAIRVDAIPAEGEGEAAFQKNLQAKRVQKCVETLDVLKVSNARIKHVVITTKWETFESPTRTPWEFFD